MFNKIVCFWSRTPGEWISDALESWTWMQKAIYIFMGRRCSARTKLSNDWEMERTVWQSRGMIFLFYFYEISINILRKARLTWTPVCFSPHALTFHVLCHLMSSFHDWEFQSVSVLVLRTFPEEWNPCLKCTFNQV